MHNKQSSSSFTKCSFLFVIISHLLIYITEELAPTFVTSLTDCKTGYYPLALTPVTTANGFDSASTTIPFPSAFSQAPNVALGISYLHSTYSTTTSLYTWAYDIYVNAASTTNFLVYSNFTTTVISQIAINYLAVLPTSFLQITYSKIDLSGTTLYTSTSSTPRSIARTINYRTKSNSSNAVVVLSTVGMNTIRQTVHTYVYSLTISAQYINSYEVTVTVGAYNRIMQVAVQGISYQLVATIIYPPNYLSIGYISDFSGTITDNSGATGVTVTGIIFTGMTDWTIDDTNGVNNMNMSFSANTYSLTSTSLTSCRNSYVWYRQQTCVQYYYLSNHICYTCDITCNTCSGPSPNQCLTCTSTRSLNISSGSCTCISNYVDQGARQCTLITCDEFLCRTCSYINQCGSCYSILFRQLNGTNCVCMKYRYDHYAIDQSPFCDPCHYSCFTCTNGASTSCTSCNTARDNRNFLSSSSTCPCIAKYYDNNATICALCNYTCATCVLRTYCTSCDISKGRVFDATVTYCACSPGLYDDRLQEQCQTCMYTCATCSSGTTCLTCPSTRTLANTSIANYQCICIDGYYDNTISKDCLRCQYTCQSCIGPTLCQSCSAIMHRQFNNVTRLCICSTGYYDDNANQLCATCHIFCLGCTGPLYNNCTSCDASNFRTLTLYSQCVCSSGYYQFDNFTKLCANCSYTCATCTNGTDCTSCSNLKFRTVDPTNSSKCICMAGYYDSGNQLCSKCPYYCLTCTNFSSCLTCDLSTRNFSIGCSCLDGYYDDGISSSCLSCLSQCVTCTNPYNCTSCTPIIKYLTSTARCKCSPGYLEPSCTVCAYQCQQCTGVIDNCVSCNGLMYRYYQYNNSTSKGDCLCYQGYYSDNVNALCKPCHYSCLNCTTSSTSCLACPASRQFDTNNQYCVCVSQYYQNSQSLNCLLCLYSCANCTDYSICTDCNAAKFRTLNSITKQCTCNNGYYDDGNSQLCFSCAPQCLTCSSYIVCLTCDLSNKRRIINNVTNRCICTQGYYQSTTDYLCYGCHYSCLICIDGVSCLACVSGRVLDLNTGLCRCADGTFQNSTTLTCQLCVYPCNTCTSSSSTCTQCESSHILLVSSSSCYCPSGTYQNSTKCASCMPTCQTCTANNSCSGCRNSDNRQLTVVSSLNLCICINGYQDENGVNVVCAQCHYSCATCNNSYSCLRCKDIRQMLNGTNSICSCPQLRYYDDGSNAACLPCSYLCQSCNKLSSNCTSCSAPSYRYIFVNDAPTNSSTCLCLNKYFSVGSGIQTCNRCQYSCSTCTSLTSCQTCNATLFRILNPNITAFCTCISGYFDVNNTQLCQICSYTCLTCSQTSTYCLTCPNTRVFNTNTCPCINALFDDLVSQNPVCQSCLYMCQTCSNSTSCLGCPLTRSMNDSSLCACLSGYYDTLTSKICLACSPVCKECTDYQTCTLCFDSTQLRILYNSACICEPGYYDPIVSSPNSTNYTCQLCHHSCQRCQNGLSCSSCDSLNFRVRNVNTGLCKCIDGYYDDNVNELCLACSFDCLTCADGTSCLTCPSQRYLDTINAPYRCLCSSSYYTNNTLCQTCPAQCLNCTSLTQCTVCNNPTQRTQVLGSCLCNSKLYPITNSASCQACFYSCQTCTSYPFCSTCNSTYHRYLSTKQCKCLPSFYDDLSSQICQPCQRTCLTCTNSTQCLTCDTSPSANRIFDSVTRFCKCNIGYYEDSTFLICLSCQYSCYTCSSVTSCTSCSPTSMRTLTLNASTNQYQCLCPSIGYFDQVLNPTCLTCDPTCYTCSSSTFYSCLSCNTNVTFRVLTSNRTCVCSDGYFIASSLTITCSLCSYKCLTCTNISTQCTTCLISNSRDNGTLPNCSCLLGYYDDGNNSLCQLCDYRCLSCLDPYKCQNCDTINDHRSLNLVSQMCQCLNRYYETSLNAINRDSVCQQCNYQCLTCNHPTLCITCDLTNNTRIFNNGQCLCTNGYYDNGTSILCLPCSYVCLTCLSAHTCLDCDPLKNRVYNSTSGLCQCPRAYYDIGNGIDSMCYACQSSCFTCTNSTYCKTCPPLTNKYINSSQGTNFCICLYGYYQSPSTNGICQKCHYSCQRCAGTSTGCTVCDATAYRYLSGGSCLCQSQYFDDGRNQLCLMCTANCTNCFGSNAGQCIKCINGTYLLNGVCLNSCPEFYYAINSTWVCQSCSSYCRICTDSLNCLTCQSGFYLIPYSLTTPNSTLMCTHTCPQFYYHNTSTCLACISPCYHCTQKYICVDCISQYFLQNSTGSCYPCHTTCRYCTSSSVLSCISCVDGYYMNSTIKLCVKIVCNANQYVNSIYGCYNCKDTYANSIQCNAYQPTKCNNGYLLIMNNITSINQCIRCDAIVGYKLIASTGTCQQVCGDGIRYNAACDDGNTLNGDGCSSICSVQSNWQCSGGNGTSLCSISANANPSISLQSIYKVPKYNKIIVLLSLNIGIRLVKQNFILKFGSNQKFDYNATALNTKYTRFQLQIQYYQSVAKDKLNVQIKSPIQSSRLLAYHDYQNIHRLLQISSPLSISLQLSLDMDIITSPPALYYSTQQRTSYSLILFITIILLHIISILVAMYFLFYVRIKTMLYIVQLFNFITILYMYTTYGLYGVSELVGDSCRGLQHYIYAFGQPLNTVYRNSTNVGYYGFGAFILSGCIVQIVVVALCVGIMMYYGGISKKLEVKQQKYRQQRYNMFRYYHIAFLYAFIPDLLLCCAIVFKWTQINSSIQTSYSWGIAIVLLIMIGIANYLYIVYSRPYAKIIQKNKKNSAKINPLPFSDKKQKNVNDKNKKNSDSIIDQVKGTIEIISQQGNESGKSKKGLKSNFEVIEDNKQKQYQNINNDPFDPFNDQQQQNKNYQSISSKSNRSQRSIRNKLRNKNNETIQDQNRTQAIIFNDNEKKSQKSVKSTKKQRLLQDQNQQQQQKLSTYTKSTTISQIQNKYQLIPLYDLCPVEPVYSYMAENAISYHRLILSQLYLPITTTIFPLLIVISVQVQTPLIRCSLLLAIQILSLIYLIASMRIKNTRTIKQLVMAIVLAGLAGCGLAGSLTIQLNNSTIWISSSDKITTTLWILQIVQICIVIFGILWNIGMFILQQVKSNEYRQYSIDKKNIEIIQKNKRKNRLRNIESFSPSKIDQQRNSSQTLNNFGMKNVFSNLRNASQDYYEGERNQTKNHLRMDSQINTPAQYNNQNTNSNILLALGQSPNKNRNVDIEDIENLQQQNKEQTKNIKLNKKLKSAISTNQKISDPKSNKDKQKQMFLKSLQQIQINNVNDRETSNNLQSTRINPNYNESIAVKKGNKQKQMEKELQKREGKQSRMDAMSRNNFMALLQNQMMGEDANQTFIIAQINKKGNKNSKDTRQIDKDNTLISYKQSQTGYQKPKNKKKNTTKKQGEQNKQQDEQENLKKKNSFSIIKDLIPTRQHDEDPNVPSTSIIHVQSLQNKKQKIQSAFKRYEQQQSQDEQSNQSQSQNSNLQQIQKHDKSQQQQQVKISNQTQKKVHYKYEITGKSNSKSKPKQTKRSNQIKKIPSNRTTNIKSKQKPSKNKKIKRALTNPYQSSIINNTNQVRNKQQKQQYIQQEEIEPRVNINTNYALKKQSQHKYSNQLPQLPSGIRQKDIIDGLNDSDQDQYVIKRKDNKNQLKNKIKKQATMPNHIQRKIDQISVSSISQDINMNLDIKNNKNRKGAFQQESEQEAESQGVTVFKKILKDYQIYKDKRGKANPNKKKY